jgi:pimeloyl-ACP methyl ester carboxylesterase
MVCRLWTSLASMALALTGAGCGGEKPPAIVVPEDAKAGDLALEPCIHEARRTEYGADCGTFVVPENRSDPDSRVIALPVIRVRSTGSEASKPIFFLQGGPGVSNMGFSRLSGLIERHDIVMVGYRGIDGSAVLDCPEINALFRKPPAGLLSQTLVDAVADGYRRCAERLHAEGVDTKGYKLTEVIDDMEDARQALGYDRINLLSQSYGTRLALIYAWMYPESIHRSAMISVNPPGHFIWDPQVIDEQLHYYADLCRKDPECAARTDDLAASVRKVSHDMPERWLFFKIKRDNVLAATFMMLYHTDTAAKIFDAWLAAESGDASGFALVSLVIDRMLPAASMWGESAAKATSSDYFYDPNRDFLAEMNPAGSIIGSPGSILGWAAAQGWPANPIPEELRRVQPSDVEMLLIGGSIDFSTPAQAARDELLPFLTNGTQVILSEFGHTGDVWGLQPEATTHLLATFFDTGVVDQSKFSHEPMRFDAGLGFPAVAKLGLGGLVALLVGIPSIAWLATRRIVARRRRARQAGT